jgi:hypothetical protein
VTLFPYTTLFRSVQAGLSLGAAFLCVNDCSWTLSWIK